MCGPQLRDMTWQSITLPGYLPGYLLVFWTGGSEITGWVNLPRPLPPNRVDVHFKIFILNQEILEINYFFAKLLKIPIMKINSHEKKFSRKLVLVK